ncbi:MAG: ABC transporter substrate-binding protein [Candidatus Bathyarchaeota archaeon]
MKKKWVAIVSILLMCTAILVPMALPAQGQDTLFHVTLTVPSTNPSRQAWSEIIYNNMLEVGIDVDRVIQDWGTIYDRALDPPEDVRGKTFDEGGYDMLFVGYAMGTDPDPYALYHSSQVPPGQNYYNWENAENDELCEKIKVTVDETERLEYVKQWQQLGFEELPSITLHYDREVVCFDPTALVGDPFEILHYPVWPGVDRWELNPSTTQDTIVIAQTGPAPEEGLNPWVTTSYYDLTVYGAVMESLTKTKDLETLEVIPGLATDWVVEADNKTWTVTLRQGVMWHDGVEFTAEDVKFTYTAAMAEDLASNAGAFVAQIIGSPDNIEIIDNYTLKFNLPEPYAYFASSILAEGYGFMLPKHILEDVPYEEWRTHTFNTGEGSYEAGNGYTAYGPVGTGPYWYMAYDSTTYTNHLGKNSNYWNTQALTDAGLFQIENYAVVFIEGSDAAITALKTGEVDVLDSQYGLQTKLGSLEASWGEYVVYDAFGLQELGVNMKHPILGTGVDTPLGQEDPSRAAEAARYVRQAISHLVPRQEIIDSILDGYGTPAITTPVTTLTAGFDTSLTAYSYDVEEAKILLAKAGYDTGVELPSEDFLAEYGLYIGAAVVVVVVVIGAVYFVRKRSS